MSSILPMCLVNVMDDDPRPKEQHCQKKDPCMMEINGIGFLPRDVIIEILSRLPVKTLCKFRCVSKQWLNMLSRDTSFLSQHRQQSKRSNPLLLFRNYSSYSSSGEIEEEKKRKVMVDLTSIDMEGTLVNKTRVPTGGPVFSFTACGNLIVLCCAYRLYVCNPGTREFVRVPRSSSVDRYYAVGFGYLHASNVYKIVHLFGNKEMGCEIFTITDGGGVSSSSWRRISDCPYRAWRLWTNRSPVCVNGVIYWMVCKEIDGTGKKSIVLFDLEREEFGVILCPKLDLDPDFNLLFLMGFKGCLCLVDCSTSASTMDIWMLRNKIWVKEYNISLFPLDGNCEIRGVVPSDDDNGEVLIVSGKRGLICYNMENKSFRSIENSHVEERYKLPCLYHESFFSLSEKGKIGDLMADSVHMYS